jgi:hypothetical protein
MHCISFDAFILLRGIRALALMHREEALSYADLACVHYTHTKRVVFHADRLITGRRTTSLDLE